MVNRMDKWPKKQDVNPAIEIIAERCEFGMCAVLVREWIKIQPVTPEVQNILMKFINAFLKGTEDEMESINTELNYVIEREEDDDEEQFHSDDKHTDLIDGVRGFFWDKKDKRHYMLCIANDLSDIAILSLIAPVVHANFIAAIEVVFPFIPERTVDNTYTMPNGDEIQEMGGYFRYKDEIWYGEEGKSVFNYLSTNAQVARDFVLQSKGQ